MKCSVKEIQHYFRVVLGELSVEEIVKNRELILRAELINNLFLKSA